MSQRRELQRIEAFTRGFQRACGSNAVTLETARVEFSSWFVNPRDRAFLLVTRLTLTKRFPLRC
ncbi:hypothetical protein RCH11_000050 [Glaciihabitans sp. GrIS 2.15]|nr:hypothetical protein [Glaciihabitans sp. GrIS 2.15]